MALKLFFRFRQGFNGLYLAGLQRDRFQLLSTKALTAQFEHCGIVKDAVQRTQQGGIFIEILAPQSGILVTGKDHIVVAFLVVAPVN